MSYYGDNWDNLPRTVWGTTELVIEVRHSPALSRTTTIVYFADDAEEAFRLEGGPYSEMLLSEVYGIREAAHDLGVAAGQNILAGKLRSLLGVTA